MTSNSSSESFFIKHKDAIRKIGIGLGVVVVILCIVFLVRWLLSRGASVKPLTKEEPIVLRGKLETATATTGSAPESYRIMEGFTSDKINEMNKFLHISVIFTPPSKHLEKCEYLCLRRTLPGGTEIDYKINNPCSDKDATCTQGQQTVTRESDMITLHTDSTTGVEIITDQTKNSVSYNKLFKQDPDKIKIMLYGDKCESNSQVSDDTPNTIGVFYKIDSSWYSDPNTATFEESVKDDEDADLTGSIDIPISNYKENMEVLKEDALEMEIGGLSAELDIDITNSSILDEEVYFFLGLKKSGDGSLDKLRFFSDEDDPYGRVLTRSIFSQKNAAHPQSAYVKNGPVFTFYDISSEDNRRTSFKIKQVKDDSDVNYLTHDITNDISASSFGATSMADDGNNLKFTTNENLAKRFYLVETAANAIGEGSFKLCLKDGYLGKSERWVVCLNTEIDLNKLGHDSKPVKIFNTANMFPSSYQYCVYCPFITGLSGSDYNIFGLENGPTSSNFMHRLKFHPLPSLWESEISIQLEETVYSLINKNLTYNDNNVINFEEVDDEIDGVYHMNSIANKYVVKSNEGMNYGLQTDPIAKVIVLGYPTTAALRIRNTDEDNKLIHAFIFYEGEADTDNYRLLRNPGDSNGKARGGKYVQVLIRKR